MKQTAGHSLLFVHGNGHQTAWKGKQKEMSGLGSLSDGKKRKDSSLVRTSPWEGRFPLDTC